ncbi:MAG: hypothetical protein IPN10_12840 [Saprospiraceae bacterium]|nr:hypothetical protein [Saprospiraceae bacterium]
MSTSVNPEYIITQLKRLVESDKRSEIRLNANGGNSILLVCPPELEYQYIEKLAEMMPSETYQLIDINEMLISFVDLHRADIAEMFDILKGSVNQIFKAPEGEKSPDFFKHLLGAIDQTFVERKIPVLIHSGALYGSGIDNIHLMENELVMKAKSPLIILYPATQEGEQLMFLNSRPASKYRCMIVNQRIEQK